MADHFQLMHSFKRFALQAAIVTLGAPALFSAWSSVLWLIGGLTDSGPVGTCGPYGPWGGVLFLALLAGLLAAIPAALLIARRVADRFLPDLLTSQSPNPDDPESD